MEDVRSYNVGNSNYSKHKIQPWDIWEEYQLNPWDADIVKRILRTKEEPGKTPEESRKMDYEKIIHICNERIRQIDKKHEKQNNEIIFTNCDQLVLRKANHLLLTTEQHAKYHEFTKEHAECSKKHPTTIGGGVSIVLTPTSVGTGVVLECTICGKIENITEYDKW